MPGVRDRGFGRGDKDPGSPRTGAKGPRSPGRRDRGPESLGMGDTDPGIGTRRAWILGQGRRGPGMFKLFYLLDKIKLGMFIIVTFDENRLNL